jgi:hypothetical protein
MTKRYVSDDMYSDDIAELIELATHAKPSVDVVIGETAPGMGHPNMTIGHRLRDAVSTEFDTILVLVGLICILTVLIVLVWLCFRKEIMRTWIKYHAQPRSALQTPLKRD